MARRKPKVGGSWARIAARRLSRMELCRAFADLTYFDSSEKIHIEEPGKKDEINFKIGLNTN